MLSKNERKKIHENGKIIKSVKRIPFQASLLLDLVNEKFLSTAIYSKWIVKYFRKEHHIAIYYLCFIFRYTHKNKKKKKERNYNINVKELSFRDSALEEKNVDERKVWHIQNKWL